MGSRALGKAAETASGLIIADRERKQRESEFDRRFQQALSIAQLEMSGRQKLSEQERTFKTEQSELERQNRLEVANIRSSPLGDPLTRAILAQSNPELFQMMMQQQLQQQQPGLIGQATAQATPVLPDSIQPAASQPRTSPIRSSITGGIPNTPTVTDFVAGGMRGTFDPTGQIPAQQSLTKERVALASKLKGAIRQIDELAQQRDEAFPALSNQFLQRNVVGPLQEFGTKAGIGMPPESKGFIDGLESRIRVIMSDLGVEKKLSDQEIQSMIRAFMQTRSSSGERIADQSSFMNIILSKFTPEERSEILSDPEMAQIMQKVSQGGQGQLVGQTVTLPDGSTATITKILQ